MDCKIIKFFLLFFFIYFKSYAVEFNGKFIQGHYIIGKADPNSTVLIDKKKSKFLKMDILHLDWIGKENMML